MEKDRARDVYSSIDWKWREQWQFGGKTMRSFLSRHFLTHFSFFPSVFARLYKVP